MQLEHLLQFCHEKPEFDDVRRICEIEIASLPEQTPAKGETQQADSADNSGLVRGFVYLIKSGSDYKIGATKDFEQRISAFNHQLPHPPKEVHRITTDDSFGIEKYWHRRFDSKRIRGEWFSLTQAGVAAFRKRKFM